MLWLLDRGGQLVDQSPHSAYQFQIQIHCKNKGTDRFWYLYFKSNPLHHSNAHRKEYLASIVHLRPKEVICESTFMKHNRIF